MLEFLDMENTLFRQYFQHRQDFPPHNLAKPCGLHDPHDLSPILSQSLLTTSVRFRATFSSYRMALDSNHKSAMEYDLDI